MSVSHQKQGRGFRKRRVRACVSGTSDCPRLSVFRSLCSLSVQAIDDISGRTVASASLRDISRGKTKGKTVKNTIENAHKVGELIAEKCLSQGFSKAIFDRNGYRYHGRVRAVAEGARGGGLIF